MNTNELQKRITHLKNLVESEMAVTVGGNLHEIQRAVQDLDDYISVPFNSRNWSDIKIDTSGTTKSQPEDCESCSA